MAEYAWTSSALMWVHVNHLINGLHKQISCKNCLYAINLYLTILANKLIYRCKTFEHSKLKIRECSNVKNQHL